MLDRNFLVAFLLVLAWLVAVLDSGAGDDYDLRYRVCVKECEESTGCVGQVCFPSCGFYSYGVVDDHPWYMQELHYRWKKGVCQNDCRRYCKQKELLYDVPVKYHGKWPLRRTNYAKQDYVAAASSYIILVMHLRGWVIFSYYLYDRMPLTEDNRAYYEYATLWPTYGLLSLNFWFWNIVFHIRDFGLTEKLDNSSALALLGYSLIVALLRSFSVTKAANRVMVAAPLFAFVTTHIMYINFYKLDYGMNTKICLVMAVAELSIWTIWAGVTRPAGRWKIWVVLIGGCLAMVLGIFDFPPSQKRLVDAQVLWHATTIPLTFIWWSFIRDDAEFQSLLTILRIYNAELETEDLDTTEPVNKANKKKKKKKN